MSPKTLVCPLAASVDYNDLAAVIAFCEQHGLHLKIPLIRLEPPTPLAVQVPLSDEWVIAAREARLETGERARSLEQALHDQSLSADVQAIVCSPYQISEIAGIHGRFSDLTLASASTRSQVDLRNRILFGLLFESGRPVLVEPAVDKFALTLAPRSVVVAWDGGLPASRAVMLATAVLKSAEVVEIVCIDQKGVDAIDGQSPGWDLATYLARHDIKVTVTELPSGGVKIDEVLTRHATEVGAELIVMGAYGHSRLRERLLGGTSRAILDHGGLPIFMAH